MKALSTLAKLVLIALPLAVAGCSQTGGQGGASPSLSLIAPVDAPEPGTVAVDDAAKKETLARELRAEREKQIARLKEYAAAGRFAMNVAQPGLAFVWRDEQGRLCAMAHLVNASGRSDLVDRVAREQNSVQLASVKEGDLHDWMLRSGLTVEEIQLVQEPGFMARQFPDMEWEVARKRDHLRAVVDRLERDTDASIAIAVERLLAEENARPSA